MRKMELNKTPDNYFRDVEQTAFDPAHIVAFEKSGHNMFLEETDKFNSELIKFAGK